MPSRWDATRMRSSGPANSHALPSQTDYAGLRFHALHGCFAMVHDLRGLLSATEAPKDQTLAAARSSTNARPTTTVTYCAEEAKLEEAAEDLPHRLHLVRAKASPTLEGNSEAFELQPRPISKSSDGVVGIWGDFEILHSWLARWSQRRAALCPGSTLQVVIPGNPGSCSHFITTCVLPSLESRPSQCCPGKGKPSV